MAQTKSKSLPKREELPLQDTWDLEAIYATNDKWEEEFSEVKRLLPEVKQFQGKLGESADTLFQFFQKQDELTKSLGSCIHTPI